MRRHIIKDHVLRPWLLISYSEWTFILFPVDAVFCTGEINKPCFLIPLGFCPVYSIWNFISLFSAQAILQGIFQITSSLSGLSGTNWTLSYCGKNPLLFLWDSKPLFALILSIEIIAVYFIWFFFAPKAWLCVPLTFKKVFYNQLSSVILNMNLKGQHEKWNRNGWFSFLHTTNKNA